MKDEFLAIYYMQFDDTFMPRLSASIIIETNLKIHVFVDGKKIKLTNLSHILENGTITRMSQVVNVMALVKNWAEDPKLIPSWVDITIDCMNNAINFSNDTNLCRKLTFLLEQLQLYLRQPNGRRYSPSLLAFSYAILSSSSGAYKTLRDQDVICLPSLRKLQNITYNVEMPQKNDDQYLKLRMKSLSTHESHVSLIIDEIYVAKRVELAGNVGHVTGLTADQETASTVLCYMISSVIGKNRDVVAMYPIRRLTAETLEKATKQVLCRMEAIGFNVIGMNSVKFFLASAFNIFKLICSHHY